MAPSSLDDGSGEVTGELNSMKENHEETTCADANDQEYVVVSAAGRKAIKMMITRAQGLDLCFLIDATASMQDNIEMVKEEVAGMAAAIKAAYSACTVRVSRVIYRDYDDPITMDYANAVCDFTSDFTSKSVFIEFLSSVRASGGGDAAEDIFTGLERVACLDWQASNRLLVHIGDSPCHRTQFHTLSGKDLGGKDLDKYPKGDKLGRNIKDLLQKLHQDCKVSHYVFCHLRNTTFKMLREFTKVVKGAAPDDWIKELPIQSIRKIPQEVIEISCTTICNTLSTVAFNTSRTEELKLSTQEVVPSVPDWRSIDVQRGRRYKHKTYHSLDDLLMKIQNRNPLAVEKLNPIEIKIATYRFSAEGVTRWPFYASIVDPDGARNMVVKRLKRSDGHGLGSFHSEEQYLRQMEVQSVSAHLASEFNDRTKSIGIANVRPVEFILVTTLHAGFQFFNLEKHLKGNWIRYSNNAGYVNTQEYADKNRGFHALDARPLWGLAHGHGPAGRT